MMVALSLLVLAQVSAEPIHLRFEAPAGCPDEAKFREAVSRRASVRFVEPDDAGRTFSVSIAAVQDSFVGALTVRDADGDEARRAFTSPRCEEVSAALALVAAAAIEQRAPARKILTFRVPEVATPAEPVRPPAPPRPPAPWQAAAGASFSLVGGAAPSPLATPSLFVELSRGDFSARLHAGYSVPQVAAVGDAGARFSLALLRADACLSAARTSRLTANGCAGAEGGALFAEGIAIANGAQTTLPWAAAGLSARLSLAATARLSFEAEGGATFPLIRARFYFLPDVTVHQVPVMTGFFGFSARWSIG